MIEVEILGMTLLAQTPTAQRIEALCTRALNSVQIDDGHVAIEFVDERRIADLNSRFRGRARPTDVLSFPIDGGEGDRGRDGVPVELGDIVICPQHTSDLEEAIIHGALHLAGMDHETDDGEMLALQRTLLESERDALT